MQILARFLFGVLCAFSSCLCVSEDLTPIEIGLIYFSAPLSKDMDFSATEKHLREVFYPRPISVRTYSSSELEDKIKAGGIDFFFASSGFYWRMLPFGVRDIATVITDEKPKPNFGAAGAFIALRSRNDIVKIADMEGKSFVANYPSAFHGFRTGMAELAKRGYDHEKFFSSIKFIGESAEKIIDSIIKGDAEVGYVRACWLEEFEHRNISVLDKIKVIEPKAGPIACLHSTRYYPNNTFGATHRVSSELATQVSVALLTMKGQPETHRWSVATDFKPVDDMYKVLKAGPYEHLRHWNLKRIWEEYWGFVLLFIAAIFGLIAHSWRAGVLVEKRSRQLMAEVNRRKHLQAKANEMAEKMESLQKMSLVGQLSSMFAHEMNQPLAACTYFIDGLKLLCKQDKVDSKKLQFSLDQVTSQLSRASGIVSKVRQYAKSEATRGNIIELSSLCDEIVKGMEIRFGNEIHINADIQEKVEIQGDLLECQLLIWNLLKNAAEASKQSKNSEVNCRLEKSSQHANLIISNSGVKLNEEEVKKIFNTFFHSQKKNGLGIGLAIVQTITEAMAAQLKFRPRVDGGLEVSIQFNLARSVE